MTSPTNRRRSPLASVALGTQPDRRLVELTHRGHEAAFEEIVRRYRAPLVGFACTFVPFHRAEDVVQSALAAAHGALTDGEANVHLRAWLFTIVRNTALNNARDELDYEELNDSYDGVPQPPAVAERREAVREAVAALMTLPAQQREALVGRELEGRGHAEIAARLGVTSAAVRGLIFRARDTLRGAAGFVAPLPIVLLVLDGSAAGAVGAAGGWTGTKMATVAVVATMAAGGGVAVDRIGADGGHGGRTLAAQDAGSISTGALETHRMLASEVGSAEETSESDESPEGGRSEDDDPEREDEHEPGDRGESESPDPDDESKADEENGHDDGGDDDAGAGPGEEDSGEAEDDEHSSEGGSSGSGSGSGSDDSESDSENSGSGSESSGSDSENSGPGSDSDGSGSDD